MSHILAFDLDAFRRANRPWLIGGLALSLAGDLWLLLSYDELVSNSEPTALAFGSVGVLFLFLLNVGCKVFIGYVRKKLQNRWQSSYVLIEQDEIVHYILRDSETRKELDLGDEKPPWSFINPKEVFIRVDFYHIRSVHSIKRRLDGALIVDGTIDRQIRDEFVQEDPLNPIDQWENGLRRYVIPDYYMSLDELENALRKLAYQAP